MTELEEVTNRIMEIYPDAHDIIPEPRMDWVKHNYEGGVLWTGFDTWKCLRHGGVFAPKPEQMRAYRFNISDKSTGQDNAYHLVVTDCPDPKCQSEPHKLCIFY